MELRHLRYFVAVAEELSVRRAAERLHLAQPSLSRQIRDLEEEIGTRLFERDHHHVQLTPAGEVLLAEARVALSGVETVLQATRDAGRGLRGTLRIGNIGALSTTFLPGSLAALRERFPTVGIEVVELGLDEQVAALVAGTIDLGFQARARGTRVDARFAVRAASACDLMVIVPEKHRLAARPTVALAELSEEPLLDLEPRPGAGYDRWVQALCEAAGKFVPRFHRPVVDNTLAVYALVAAGEGVAILPESVIRNANLGMGWVARPLGPPRLRFEVVAAWNPARPCPLRERYIAFLPTEPG